MFNTKFEDLILAIAKNNLVSERKNKLCEVVF